MIDLKPLPLFRPKLVFTKPILSRLPERKYVTIAAGFPCKTGLVICADTQETIAGYVKTDTEKIKLFQAADKKYNVVFTGAGNGDLIDTAINEMTEALSAEKPEGLVRIAILLKKTMLKLFQDCIQPYASFPNDDRPSVTMLIGVQSPRSTALYKAAGTSFSPLHEAECIGYGIALGKSLIKQLFKPEMTIDEAALAALYVLHEAKRWVDGCGGNSDILLLTHDGQILRMGTEWIISLERHFDEFNQHLTPLRIACADRHKEHDDFDKILSEFDYHIQRLRGRFVAELFTTDRQQQELFLKGYVPRTNRKRIRLPVSRKSADKQ